MSIDPTDRVVLLRISRLHQEGMTEERLYEATRGWVMRPAAHDPEWAFAVSGGEVRAVHRIHGWELGADGRRWGLVGERDRSMDARCAGRDVSEYLRGQNPVTYVHC